MPTRNRFLIRLAGGILGVASVAFLFSRFIPANPSTVGFFFLIVVLATASGFVAAIVVSICATLAYNYYFLPPIGQFTIADPENWVALFTIVLTSLVASHLSHRAQKDAAEAKRSQQETERLYAFSRAILLNDATRSIGPQAAQSIAQIFDAPPPPSSTENRTPSIVADPSKSRPESPIPKPAFMSRPARRAL